PVTGTLTATPASITFGNVQVGTSQAQSEILSNTGGNTLTISQVAVTGPGFSTAGLSLPVTLSPGQSISFNVVFSPQSAGSATGNLAVTNDGSNSAVNIALTGTAVAAGSLTASPTSFTFGSVQVNTSQTQTETLRNSGTTNLTISQATFSGAGFSYTGLSLPLTLAANQSTTFGVVFAPTAVGAANSILSITVSGSSTTVDIALSGAGVTPATLTATPATLSFTSVQVGKSQAQTETVQNTGGLNATISQGTVSGTGFSISGLSTPVTLTPGQSTTFTLTFAPQSAGNSTGSVAIASNASNTNLTISLSGSATGSTQGQLSVSPTTIGVGNVTVGTSGTQTGSLNATGASVTVTGVTVGSSEFAISGLTFPVTIAAGKSAGFTVTFTPQSSGLASTSASFASNATNSPAAATLTGTGVAAPAYSVSLTWVASTSQNVVGYNVYRRIGTTGSFTQINPVLDATTAYTDSSVTDGQTYYYETTAVSSSNEESAPSTAVSAKIPAP
ncbi:MAG TPA: choice-of-anchor D domain-containing protein, partial [Candidatus Sulfotelmatobacter sp.]|nr:choice-of-anchor D domain-containing protein [Candidatus Sulfotelmatobacter sp.]